MPWKTLDDGKVYYQKNADTIKKRQKKYRDNFPGGWAKYISQKVYKNEPQHSKQIIRSRVNNHIRKYKNNLELTETLQKLKHEWIRLITLYHKETRYDEMNDILSTMGSKIKETCETFLGQQDDTINSLKN